MPCGDPHFPAPAPATPTARSALRPTTERARAGAGSLRARPGPVPRAASVRRLEHALRTTCVQRRRRTRVDRERRDVRGPKAALTTRHVVPPSTLLTTRPSAAAYTFVGPLGLDREGGDVATGASTGELPGPPAIGALPDAVSGRPEKDRARVQRVDREREDAAAFAAGPGSPTVRAQNTPVSPPTCTIAAFCGSTAIANTSSVDRSPATCGRRRCSSRLQARRRRRPSLVH